MRHEAERRAGAKGLQPRCAAALVALIAFVSFLPALRAGFVYDDSLLIANNALVQSSDGLLSAFSGHFWQTEALGNFDSGLTYYRPVVTLSFVLNWLAFGGAAWGFHLVNLLLHASAALLATRAVALRWTARPWLAVLVGVLFAVHPTRTESVISIAGRTDILMSIFGLLSVELLHRARESGRASQAWLGVTCVAVALLCKESAAVLPVLLLADALRDQPQRLEPSTRRHLLAAVALCAAYVLLRSTVLPVRHSHSTFLPAYGFMTIATYAERLVWPWPQTFFFRNLELGPTGVVYPAGLVAAGVVLASGYAALLGWAFRRDRAAATSLAAAALLLAPVLNFFETGLSVSVFDHFLYLPLFLLLLGGARLFAARLAHGYDQLFLVATLVVVVTCLLPNTLRAADFKDDRTLWARELALDPDNAVALDWMSSELLRAGQPRDAARLLERASSPAARRRFMLADKSADARRRVRRAVLTASVTPDGDVAALSRFADELERFAGSTSRRGQDALEAELATLTSRLGRADAAKHWLQRAPRDHPEFLPNPLNLVLVQARVGDFAGALETLQRLDAAKRAVTDRATLERLAQRLGQAQSYLDAARLAPDERKPMLRALGALELGSSLVACRELRAAYLINPAEQRVAQLYARALMAARLDAEAERVITRAIGPEQAAQIVASLRQSLPPIQRELPPAPDGDAWWQDARP